MIQSDALFNTYIDANILLAEAVLLWLAVCWILELARLKPAPRTRLFLLNGVCLTVLVSPLLVAAMALGLAPQGLSVNLTDFLLALYLNGSIQMRPSEFEQVLDLRESFTSDIVGMQSLAGLAVVALLGIGLLLFSTRMAGNVIRLRRLIRSSYAWHRSGSVHIRLSDTIAVPFSTRSLTRRFVVIPSELLAHQRDLKIVLQHEFQHLRQSDIEWEIAMEFLRLFFFWNPAFHVWKRQVEDLREIACDQRVLARSSISAKSYCECLVRVCQNSLRRNTGMVPSMPLVGLIQFRKWPLRKRSAVGLKRRIAAIIEGREHRSSRYLTAVVMAPLALVVAFSALAIQSPPDWSYDRIMLSTIVNLERLDAINGLGTRPLR